MLRCDNPIKQNYLCQSSSSGSVILMQKYWRHPDKIFYFHSLRLWQEWKVNKVIKYSIWTRKWNVLNVQLCRRVNFELYWVAFWGARSLVDPHSHSHAHGKDVIYAKIFPSFVHPCVWVLEGHRKMTHCCHSSNNKDLLGRVEKLNYSHSLVGFQMSIFGCFQ